VTSLVIILELHSLNKVECNDKKGGVREERCMEDTKKVNKFGVPRTLAYDRKNSLLIRIQTGLNNNI